MENKLDRYKSLLEIGSYEGLRYIDENKTRYVSFNLCLDFLGKIEDPVILELGTCRSFVDGKFEGCNLDDEKYWDSQDFSKWDWGAGCFSLIFGKIPNIDLTTVDLMESHLKRCKIMTNSLGIKCQHILSDSLHFLNTTEKRFDLIYLDTGDMWPIDPTCELQLRECEIIIKRNLLKDDGILLIDDVLNGTPREQGDKSNTLGKSEKSIPYLLSQGFKIKFEGYQYILCK